MARRDHDDDAPWLAEAGDSPQTRVSRRSLFWTLAILLTLAVVAAIGLIMLLSRKDGGSTQGYMNAEQAPLITAEPGPYKVPPLDPKGLDVEGQGQTIYEAGEGIDQGSVIDQSAVPEAPMPRPGSEPAAGPPVDLVPDEAPQAAPGAAAPAPVLVTPPVAAPVPTVRVAAPQPVPAKPVVAPAAKPKIAVPAKPVVAAPKPALAPTPTPAPARKSGTVQLGAFSSAAKADAAWTALAARHGLGGWSKRVIPVESNGTTLYRLRGTGGDSAEICKKLKAAGDTCAVVD